MSLATLGIPLGSISASVVLLVMSKTFSTSGWRVAMLLPVVIVIPALLARYKLADTPLFEQLKQTDKLAALPSFGVLKHHSRSVILLALVWAFQSMGGYTSGTYLFKELLTSVLKQETRMSSACSEMRAVPVRRV
jgi:MFS family permease